MGKATVSVPVARQQTAPFPLFDKLHHMAALVSYELHTMCFNTQTPFTGRYDDLLRYKR